MPERNFVADSRESGNTANPPEVRRRDRDDHAALQLNLFGVLARYKLSQQRRVLDDALNVFQDDAGLRSIACDDDDPSDFTDRKRVVA